MTTGRGEAVSTRAIGFGCVAQEEPKKKVMNGKVIEDRNEQWTWTWLGIAGRSIRLIGYIFLNIRTKLNTRIIYKMLIEPKSSTIDNRIELIEQ